MSMGAARMLSLMRPGASQASAHQTKCRGGNPGGKRGTMKLLTYILGPLRSLVKVTVIAPGACVICEQGPNPTTGVPLRCANGTSAHLTCLLGISQRAQWN